MGIGASAGGLDAFEQFFRAAPVDTGLAFVLVPHLDPEHASALTEILQRCTPMPVVQATDGMRVVPNAVYIIPPNRDMVVFHGALQLSTPERPRGHRMPIDNFLASLAEDQGERSIGVILSGTGSDGTLGLRAILAAGGVSLVQEPTSAKYDGMPESAIRAKQASYVLPVDKMPAALVAGARAVPAGTDTQDLGPVGINGILHLLRSGTGNDFSQYKKSTIVRRVERRMTQHNITDMEVYARFIREHPTEVRALFKEVLINVTSFFRDPEAFVALKAEILPRLLADKPEGYVFRVWVPACATGEEVYSIAILLRELIQETHQRFKIQLYGTDLAEDAISVARGGFYPTNVVQDITPDRLHRYFTKEEGGYRIAKEIREMAVFAVQNAIKDPPFTRLDLLCCRNLMIYLEPELQNQLLERFHYALKPGGVLFLSPSETFGNHPDMFAPLSHKWKFFQALHGSTRTPRVTDTAGGRMAHGKPAPEGGREEPGRSRLAEMAQHALLQSYAPASVVTDLHGNILHVHGETGRYLRPAPGPATLNVVEMAREGLQAELRLAVDLAIARRATTLGREVSMKGPGDAVSVSLSVRPLPDPDGGLDLLLVSFQELAVMPPAASPVKSRRPGSVHARRIVELERSLAYTKESLHATIEEQQASNEELKSANEEMQSTNEEMQSTNEELETSKEELHSMNEELVTVNAELQGKIEQLATMQNDMKNLLDNINIGLIFLDENLVIRRFTREVLRAFRLVASDIGRPLADIKSDLAGEDLLADAQSVLDSLVPVEREVHNSRDASFLVRVQPYRTLENFIGGVVLTFMDITRAVEARRAAQEARELAEGIVNTVREPLVVLDGKLQVVSASAAFYDRFQMTMADTVGHPLYELGTGQWNIPALRHLLENVLPRDQRFDNFVLEYASPATGPRTLLLNASRVVGQAGDTRLILLTIDMAPTTEPAPP